MFDYNQVDITRKEIGPKARLDLPTREFQVPDTEVKLPAITWPRTIVEQRHRAAAILARTKERVSVEYRGDRFICTNIMRIADDAVRLESASLCDTWRFCNILVNILRRITGDSLFTKVIVQLPRNHPAHQDPVADIGISWRLAWLDHLINELLPEEQQQ